MYNVHLKGMFTWLNEKKRQKEMMFNEFSFLLSRDPQLLLRASVKIPKHIVKRNKIKISVRGNMTFPSLSFIIHF